MTPEEDHIFQQFMGMEGVSRGLANWFLKGKDAKVTRCLDQLSIMIENVRPDWDVFLKESKVSLDKSLQEEYTGIEMKGK